MTIQELNAELSDAIVNFHDYHSRMNLMRNYYQNSVFYKPRSGEVRSSDDLQANLLKVFADKNIHYTSSEPIIKVPGTPEDRENASVREKIIYAVRRKSNSPLLRRRWARDTTILSAAVAETIWDAKKRCASIRRYDPRHCYWQISNDNDQKVLSFWAVFPITLEECQQLYDGKTPQSNGGIPQTAFTNDSLRHIDGKDWFLQATKWTGKTKTTWVGDVVVVPEHNHGFDEIPIDVCMPFDECNENNQGSFYLEPLLSPQAELNHVTKQRSNIVDRMANPVVWGRNIVSRGFDDLKQNMAKAGGGFVGLGRQGELGLLQVNDVQMLDKHEDRIIQQMMRLSGFGAATFGESVGANTSGDALGMYFTPTQRLIEDQNIAWNAFDQSINAKILQAYFNNMTYGEQLTLASYAPGGTFVTNEDGTHKYESGAYSVSFTKDVIGGNYNNVTIPRNVTPKDEIAEKRWALEAVAQGVISRTTAYEMFDFLSPEDELAMLSQEKSDPLLNPEGTQKILQTAQQAATAQPAAMPAAPMSVVPNGA
jgi:hypothetical protein